MENLERTERQESLEFAVAVSYARNLAESVKGVKPEKFSDLKREFKNRLTAEQIDSLRGLVSVLENVEG